MLKVKVPGRDSQTGIVIDLTKKERKATIPMNTKKYQIKIIVGPMTFDFRFNA